MVTIDQQRSKPTQLEFFLQKLKWVPLFHLSFTEFPLQNRKMNFLHYLFHIFLLVVALFIPQVVLGNAELRALMNLKSSLDPENMLLQSWTNDGDPCSGFFLGVACNEHQKVANISLPGRGLSGKLSPMVAELKCLSGLYLHYNHLRGEIPTEISNLNELVDLYLDFNNLSGSIPQDIGNLSSLQG